MNHVSVIYDFPFESRISHDPETGETFICVAAGETNPEAVVRWGMEAIRERGWTTT